jgi:hypothetical protein
MALSLVQNVTRLSEEGLNRINTPEDTTAEAGLKYPEEEKDVIYRADLTQSPFSKLRSSEEYKNSYTSYNV